MKNTSGKKTAKKIVNIAINVILWLFFAICVCALIFSIAAKRNSSGAVNVFGKQSYIVVSPSMEKCDRTDVSRFKIKDIPVNSMIFVEPVPEDEEKAAAWYAKLEPGDVLTFRYVYASQETITHRIIEISENASGGYRIVLAGDNKPDDGDVLTQTIEDTSNANSPNYVIGKVTGQSRFLGWIVQCFRSPIGLVLIIIIPCAIIIIMQVMRIFSVVNADKKKKEAELQEKQSDEIETLKRQIAALQQAQAPSEQQNAEPQAGSEASETPRSEKTDSGE